jgi:hypothetical protein
MKNIPAQIWAGAGIFVLPALFFLYKAVSTPSRFSLHLSPQLVGALLVVAGILWLMLAAKRRVATSRIAGARVETHRFGPGRPLDTIQHELGHKHAIESQGGRVTHFVVNRDGSGYVKGYLPKSAGLVGSLAVRYAGGIAEGTFAYARTDKYNAECDLKESDLAPNQYERARNEGMSKARSILFWNPVEGRAKKIYREGWK